MNMNRKINRAGATGFTLLELLLVVAVVVIISAILIFILNPAQILKRSRDRKRVSDLHAMTQALNIYVLEKGSYPREHFYDTSMGCRTNSTYPTGTSWTAGNCPASETLAAQLKQYTPLPIDPRNKFDAVENIHWGYGYEAGEWSGSECCADWYMVWTYLESVPEVGDLRRWRICGGNWKGAWVDDPEWCKGVNPDF